MTIEWKGEGCFEIRGVGDRVSLITDYPSRESGLSAPKTKADIKIFSQGDLEDTLFGDDSEGGFLISGPGEYEIKDVFISGRKLSVRENMLKTVYRISLEDVSIGFLGDSGEEKVDSETAGFLEGVDILIVPVGGNGVFGPEEAVNLVNRIEPKIVVPSHFNFSGLKLKRADLADFLKEMGESGTAQEKKILVKKKDLSFDGIKVIPLLLA